VAAPVSEAHAKPVRKKLPDERPSITHKFSVGGHEGYITVGLYPDTMMPGEIFVTMSKEGSTISGLMDGFATAISLALQYGVPVSTLVDKFIHSRFEPSGFTNNKEIPMAKSVMDYIFRWFALKFLQKGERQNAGLLADQPDASGTTPQADAAPHAPFDLGPAMRLISAPTPQPAAAYTRANGTTATANVTVVDKESQIVQMQSDAPPCPDCGALTVRSGACYKCLQCGTSLGCS
jgi:ribonucleoside-diphosphate reductase alpha chain